MGKDEELIKLVVFYAFFIAFSIAIILFIVQYRLKKKQHLTMLQHQQEQHQQELLATQLEIQHQTMQHIGREIHDNIGQKLTLASLYAQQLVYENQAPKINDNIENIGTIINQSLSELRALSKTLTDNAIEVNDLPELLEAECNKINELKVCHVQFDSHGTMPLFSYQIKSVLLRITQEFLQNSIKHAQCKNINVSLSKSNNQLQLNLQDDGKGFDMLTTNSNGIGLNNMKKRTEIIGGTFHMNSTTKGTTLVIKLPLDV